MAPIEFRAPWGRALRTSTAISVALVALIALIGGAIAGEASHYAALVVIGAPVLILVVAATCMVRGFVLTEDALLVRRLGWSTRLPLEGLASIGGDADAMHGAWRLFANGGLLSFTGVFWSRRLKRFRAFVTDPERAVVLRYADRTIVITPHDPQQFIMRARTLLKSRNFERALQRTPAPRG